ncbi:hypothetical protein JXM83_02435, partial [Candidatus Woesearchaeota archaeon]|nr:hypothetical protein [Candidatus Woesearchaeota archaeon]
ITYYLDSVVVQKVNNSITETTYIYDDSRLIASEENNITQFYLTDHQGSVDAVVDSTGNLLYDLEYLPFGLSYQDNESRYTFTGKELDLSGLMYYESRYYSPFLRRFTQPDSVIPSLYDTQSLNRYSYVRNNPVIYIDPTGHFWETLWDVFSVGWDIKDIISDPTSLLSWGALGLDLLAVIIPGIPAVGQLAKLDKFVDAAKGADKVADVVKGLDKTNDVAKGLDKVKDSSKVYGDVFKQSDEILNSKKIKPDFIGTSNGQLVPKKTPKGLEITSHAADRMANPPAGRVMMSPAEVDNVIFDVGKIKKIDNTRNTITFFDPSKLQKTEVVVSDDLARVVTVIKVKPK